jgi:sugar phosphate isomerase/epimerase
VFVAVSTRCFAELPFPEVCAQILDLEFDRLELWLDDKGGQLRPSDIAADPDGFFTQYREATRLMSACMTLAHDVRPDVMQGIVKAAKLLRVTQICLPASDLGTPFNAEIERLRDLSRIASQDGIRAAIRTAGGTLTEDPHNAIELCQAVPGLGLALDPSHYMRAVNFDRAIDLVIPHVYHVHLRDSTPQSIQVQVGLGELDSSRLISQLRRVRYDRALSIELLPEMTEADQRPLELRKMRMLLESLL